ncbi:hypothetical protein RJ640_008620 [Escallonia rubra]|uniref:Coiled-coil domain-containing protein 94 n=1 Tax=Escallonia rubra TaxID=112253 RepID=A0AA88QV66_9ASTE|nr:hypothetical protein RJ640_008620 [Escallonia rubra]
MKVTNKLPLKVRCNTCGQYMSEGTKFNCRKEVAAGETYLGIQKFRLYFSCRNCSAEFTMRSEPESDAGYVVESGVTDSTLFYGTAEDAEKEVVGDVMVCLENRRLEAKREMDVVASLHELKSMKARLARLLSDEDIDDDDLKKSERGSEGQNNVLDKSNDAKIIGRSVSKPLIRVSLIKKAVIQEKRQDKVHKSDIPASGLVLCDYGNDGDD